MASYRIICTIQSPVGQPHTHAHIVQVGTGDVTGWKHMWTVPQVYSAMDQGHTFYTQSPSTFVVAFVHKFNCPHCGYSTLRSNADAIADNNLDNLPRCQT